MAKPERLRRAKGVKPREDNYRAIFDALSDAILVHDLETGDILDVNQKMCEMFGYRREEAQRLNLAALCGGEPLCTPEKVRRLIRKAAAGSPQLFEWQAKDKTGRIFWVEMHLKRAVIAGQDRILAVIRDIGERKRTEEALKESQEGFQQLVENLDAIFWIRPLDYRQILYITSAYERIYGRSVASLYKNPKSWMEAIHPEDRERIVAKRLRGEMGEDEFRIIRPDGEIRWLNVRNFPVLNKQGEVYRIAGIGVDITERRQAEEALHKVSRALKAITECDMAMLRASSETELLQEVCRIIVEVGGYPMAWVGFAEINRKKTVRPMARYGFDEGYVDLLHVTWANNPRGQGPVGTAIRTGKPAISRDIQDDPRFAPWRREALKRGYASTIALPLWDTHTFGALAIYATDPDAFDEEEVKLLLGLANDLAYGITAIRARVERQRAEEALKESEQKLRLLTSQVLTAQENERRRVSRELHDELGQALTVLKFHLVSLEDKLRQDQEELKKECEHLLQHVDEIIENLRRLSWDLSPSILEDLGLSSSLRYLIDETCENHQISCAVTMDDINHLFSTEAQINIYRIFQESLTNIIKHAQATRLSVVIRRHGTGVSFLVEDNGKGFDVRRVLPQNVSAKRLGLTAMHERARMAGGSLNVWSQKGKGTRITFTIPIEG